MVGLKCSGRSPPSPTRKVKMNTLPDRNNGLDSPPTSSPEVSRVGTRRAMLGLAGPQGFVAAGVRRPGRPARMGAPHRLDDPKVLVARRARRRRAERLVQRTQRPGIAVRRVQPRPAAQAEMPRLVQTARGPRLPVLSPGSRPSQRPATSHCRGTGSGEAAGT